MSRASSASSSRSMPPVSIRSKATPFHSVASRLRSRVTPGSGAVTASVPPTRRLTRVLLPTLGKPTTATVALIGRPGPTSQRRRPLDQTPFAGQGDDAADDLFEAEAGGVELDRVVGGAQGAVLALGVAGVAAALGVEDRGGVLPGLGGAAARPLLVARREEDLQRRVGADHGADVAALGDVVAGRDQRPLAGDHRLAHPRVDRDARGVRGHLGAADRVADVAPVEQHAAPVEFDLEARGERRRAPRRRRGRPRPRARPARRSGTSPRSRGR